MSETHKQEIEFYPVIPGWRKKGSLWVSPVTRREWAWTDEQMSKHMQRCVGLLEREEGLLPQRTYETTKD